jgi:hypothetical protein
MNMDTTFPAFSEDLCGAVLSSYTSVTEDGTICFVSDKVHRACAECGTVFVGSAVRAVFAGPDRCPYCGTHETAPLRPMWLS